MQEIYEVGQKLRVRHESKFRATMPGRIFYTVLKDEVATIVHVQRDGSDRLQYVEVKFDELVHPSPIRLDWQQLAYFDKLTEAELIKELMSRAFLNMRDF